MMCHELPDRATQENKASPDAVGIAQANPKAGFGSTVVTRVLAAQLGGRADLDFRPDGLVCTIRCRASEVAKPAPASEEEFPSVPVSDTTVAA